MQVIRHPSYARRAANHAVVLAFLAQALLALLLSLWTPLGPFAWLLLLFLWQPSSAKRRASGERGEQKALALLRELPDDYTAVTNYVVPGSRSGDIDLLIIGPMGIVAAEVKAYAGTVLYAEGAWWRVQADGRKTPIKNVSAQARANLRAVTGFLSRAKEQNPALGSIFVPMEAALVFVGTKRLNAVNPDLTVLTVEALPAYIRRLPPHLTPEQVGAVTALFQPQKEGSDRGLIKKS